MSKSKPNSGLTRPDDFDPNKFFSHGGGETLVGPADLESIIPDDQKPYLREVERYWLNKPYSFAIIYHSRLENEYVYYAIEPALSDKEAKLKELLDESIRVEVDYDAISTETPVEERITLIQSQARDLLRRWGLISTVDLEPGEATLGEKLKYRVASFLEQQADKRRQNRDDEETTVQSTPVFFDEDGGRTTLTPDQIDKLVYYLVRDFVGYRRIDPLKHDIAIEDISCNGPEEELFIDHQNYDQLRVANIQFGEDELRRFVTTLANINGHGISRRQPEVDATLRDGSRAKLTLADEITTKGSNFTIRQFLDIPFTPVDLVNWGTFSLDQMAYLWMCIEHERSMIFAGGTASGKTTTLNAVNLFAPASKKFVTIEDTAELELPQKNWVASITRSGVTENDDNAIAEFDLVKQALRQRPDYIIMGEVRGEEGNALFQAMGSGHTSYTTFHADNPDQLIKRFSSDQIGVEKPYMDMIDAVVMQTQTRVDGESVRRSPEICEITEYDNDEEHLARENVYEWDPKEDVYEKQGESSVLEEIRIQLGWSQERLTEELRKRKVVLAKLITENYNTYGEVAGTIQAFIRDQDAVLHLIEEDSLEDYLENLQNISTLEVDVDPEREELVPRPDPTQDVLETAEAVLEQNRALLAEYETYDVTESFAVLGEEADSVQDHDEADTEDAGITSLERALADPDSAEAEPSERPESAFDSPDPTTVEEPGATPDDPDSVGGVSDLLEDSPDDTTPGHPLEDEQPQSTAATDDEPGHPLSDGAEDDQTTEEALDEESGPAPSDGTEGDEADSEEATPDQCIAITKKKQRCRNDAAEGNYFCHLEAHTPEDVTDVADGWRISDGEIIPAAADVDDVDEDDSPSIASEAASTNNHPLADAKGDDPEQDPSEETTDNGDESDIKSGDGDEEDSAEDDLDKLFEQPVGTEGVQ